MNRGASQVYSPLVCPILSIPSIIKQKCLQAKCRWWCADIGDCVVKKVTEEIIKVGERI